MHQAGDFCMWQNEVDRGYFDLTHCNVQERFKYAVHNMTHLSSLSNRNSGT